MALVCQVRRRDLNKVPQRSPAHFIMGLEKSNRTLEWIQERTGGQVKVWSQKHVFTWLCTTTGYITATLLLFAVLKGLIGL